MRAQKKLLCLMAMLIFLISSCTAAQTTGTDKTRSADGVTSAVGGPVDGEVDGPAGWTVAQENALPGTTDWRLAKHGPAGSIEGFADRVSVLSGESFRLFVSTIDPSFTVRAFRMGWYGGKQGRQVWASERIPGRKQAPPKVTPEINMVTAPWDPTTTVSTTGWPEGNYLLKLTSKRGFEQYVTMTIRSKSTAGRAVFVNAVTTWAAYNRWGGGYNVYAGPKGSPGDYANRSRKASFDRPYDKNGSYFTWYEFPMLVTAERMGLPLAYATDLDIDGDPDLFKGATALFFAGHDEYWSAAMMKNTIAIRDAGTNIAFFAANTAYRHVRMEESDLGPSRVVTVYKDPAEDPVFATDPDDATYQWRLPPNPRPESALTGVLYEGNPVQADYVVTEPHVWFFAGTGARKGSRYPGLVGVEWDRLSRGVPVPRPIQVVSESPLMDKKKPTVAHSSYYTTPSGSGVFSSGTMQWSCAVNNDQCARYLAPESIAFARKVSENLMVEFSKGPVGRVHPAVDNYEQYAKPFSEQSYTN